VIGLLVLAWLGAPAAFSADLYHDCDLDVRWDNTLQYTAAYRLFPQDRGLLTNPNWDDGDRNFDPGLISNRLDLLSEFEATYGDFGLRLSGDGWYDTVYHQKNDNDSPATFNPFSVPHNEFTAAVRTVHGEDLQLGDAFVHGSFEIRGMPVSFRAGRYTLLWGESVFFGDNSIAAGQAPTDVIRELSQPGSYSKDVFLPVWQSSILLQPTENISLGAYYQFAWRKDLLPGAGSYFSYRDYLDAGGERYIISPRQVLCTDTGGDHCILTPGHFLYRAHALRAPDSGQYGVSLQVSGSEFNYGFYALRFNAKEPQTYLYSGLHPTRGNGIYRLVYPTGIELYGASFSTYLGDSGVAGEVSYRHNMPLVSYPIYIFPGLPPANGYRPLYPSGQTLHAQVSSDTTFSASPFWQRADLAIEIAANERLSIDKNAAAIDPSADRFALAIHANFTPQYFQVLPGLDIGLPLGFGYGIAGNSSIDETQRAHAGNAEIGIAGTYQTVWRASLNLTHFIGSPKSQPLADRDFVELTIQRSF